MNSIEVRNVTKKFDAFTAVNNISFTVDTGETFAFLGPNGAGKTTTIKMLTTLLKPTSGEVSIFGYKLDQQNEIRKSFGIVFQDASLDDDLTALENMEFHGVLYGVPREERNRRITELLTLVDLMDRKNSLVKTFSGGMKRRLEIARGLIHHPRIFFLDEPTLGLDPQTRNHIWAYISDLKKKEGITVFLTTHYMDEAEKMANRVAVIDHGEIKAIGTPEELKTQYGGNTLEETFLNITGSNIRDEEASGADRMRAMGKAWGRK